MSHFCRQNKNNLDYAFLKSFDHQVIELYLVIWKMQYLHFKLIYIQFVCQSNPIESKMV